MVSDKWLICVQYVFWYFGGYILLNMLRFCKQHLDGKKMETIQQSTFCCHPPKVRFLLPKYQHLPNKNAQYSPLTIFGNPGKKWIINYKNCKSLKKTLLLLLLFLGWFPLVPFRCCLQRATICKTINPLIIPFVKHYTSELSQVVIQEKQALPRIRKHGNRANCFWTTAFFISRSFWCLTLLWTTRC